MIFTTCMSVIVESNNSGKNLLIIHPFQISFSHDNNRA
jgi:hypothetical protein